MSISMSVLVSHVETAPSAKIMSTTFNVTVKQDLMEICVK